jgi:glycosyltransferase involved in cell wall biosynthesis
MTTRKMKVLHVIKTLSLGGAETNLLNLAGAFDSERIETHVAYSFGGEIEGRFLEAGIKLFKYAHQSHRVKSLHTIPIIARLARYIRKHGIDIVQTHNFNAHIWGLIAAKLTGAKVVEHVHDFRYTPNSELARRRGLSGQYKFIRYFKNQSDRIIVLTKDNFAYVVGNGYSSPEGVIELQNGIPLDEVARDRGLRADFAIGRDDVVILTSARMEPTKNIDLILRIAGRVLSQAPRAVFLVAGDGAYLEEYKAQCAGLNLQERVRFVGFHRDMYRLLAASDIFLLPSFLELHSIAILEALKMKVPVVVSAGVGCNAEFIEHGTNGFLCDPFEEQPWIDTLVRLVTDNNLRDQCGSRGHETCRRLFNIHDAAMRIERVYADLVA